MKPDHTEYLRILRRIRELPRVKKVFVRSGIRYDYLIEDKNEEFFEELVKHHISGQLKVAPEHCSDRTGFSTAWANRIFRFTDAFTSVFMN